MQEVVPIAVRAAVRMLTMSWMMAFQVSFFIVVNVYWLMFRLFEGLRKSEKQRKP